MTWTPGSPTIKSLWGLDPSVTFLNHGSFGATPRAVLVDQARWRDEMEREPVEFLARRLPRLLAEVRGTVARFLGADPEGLAFVANATTGVNAVLRSLSWSPGDEILLANQSYNAVKQTVRYLRDHAGVVPVEAHIPFPIREPEEITAAFAAALTPRTRLLLVDHVVSPTALVCPVEALVALARSRGIPILVDGAHAPGMVPLQLDALGADFYTGNLHKWAFAPKGAAVLCVAPAWRDRIHPMSISHAYRAGYVHEFDWTGTVDPSAWLALPAALEFHASLPGLNEVNHGLVQEGRRRVAEALGTELPHPDDPRLYANLATVAVPGAFDGDFAALQARTTRLYERHRIEVPFMAFDHRVWLRVSGQAYNHPDDYLRLAEALRS